MYTFLILASIGGFIFCLVMMLNSSIKNNKNIKPWAICIGVCFSILIISSILSSKSNNSNNVAISGTNDKSTVTTVKSTKNQTIPITSISINNAKVILTVGDSYSLSAKLSPSNAANHKITWASSNNSIVTVNTIGKIKASKPGTATITATAGDKTTACTVTVNSPNYNTGITYDQLARTPKKFINKRVTFTGTVVQVMENNDETDLRIAVNDNYNNILFVKYKSDISPERILENDHVTIKGISKGLYTYLSTLGGNITIPSVSVDIITRN